MGAIITVRQNNKETAKQRREEIEQKERENLRRFDESFNAVIKELGSDSLTARASAAGSLRTFLKPRYEDFYDDVLAITIANLKVVQDDIVRDMLISAFEEAIRFKLAILNRKTRERHNENLESIDLSRAKLARADLRGLNFWYVDLDIAYAKLERANFTGSVLRRVRGFGVRLNGAHLSRTNLQEARLNQACCREAMFRESNLVSATLKGADLRAAQFHRARLQSAHFEQADLRGAMFTNTKLMDAYFYGARFDLTSLKTIVRNRAWEKGHYDDWTREQLENLKRRV